MSRCVIVGGADIRDYPRVKGYLRSDDFVIYCDSGLRHMAQLGAAPGLIVGDFDSHENPSLPVETIVLPCEKDDTDIHGLPYPYRCPTLGFCLVLPWCRLGSNWLDVAFEI